MRIICLGMYGLAMGELSTEMRMIHHLAELGHEVDYWTDAPLSYSMEPILTQPPSLRNFVFREGMNSLAKTPRQLAPEDVGRIFREHEKKPYDVIFGTAHTAIDMGHWLKRAIQLPFACQILDVPYWRIDPLGMHDIYREAVVKLPNLPSQLFEGYKDEWDYWFSHLEELDAIILIASPVKDLLLQYSGKSVGDRCHVVHHGSLDYPTAMDYLQRFEKEGITKKHRVTYLSRIDFHKGPDQAVLVCRLIQDLMPNDPPEFIFVSRGNQQWYEDLIRKFASGVLKNVKFLGWVDNPTKFRILMESKVFIDCEWPEGFEGVVLGEALFFECNAFAWDRKSKLECYPQHLRLIPKNDYEGMAREAVQVLRQNPYQPPDPSVKEFIRSYRSHESHARAVIDVLTKLV